MASRRTNKSEKDSGQWSKGAFSGEVSDLPNPTRSSEVRMYLRICPALRQRAGLLHIHSRHMLATGMGPGNIELPSFFSMSLGMRLPQCPKIIISGYRLKPLVAKHRAPRRGRLGAQSSKGSRGTV